MTFKSLRKKKKLGNKGFSLIELMVVVVIISILSAIAIPNYQRFKKRSRRAEAKVHLTGIYLAQKAFKVEFGEYTADLALIGYQCDGQERRYNAGFNGAAATFDPGSQAQREAGAVIGTRTHLGDPAYQEWVSPLPAPPGCQADLSLTPANLDQAALFGASSLSAGNSLFFTVAAAGQLGPNDEPAIDIWIIDQRKELTVITNGMTD